MHLSTRTRWPLVRTVAAFVSAGALVAMGATVSAAALSPATGTKFPAYPTTLSAADIHLAAAYTGGTAGKAATGSTIVIGFINDDSATLAYPQNLQAAKVAVEFINTDLGGIKGYRIEIDECDATTDATTKTCAATLINEKVKVVLTGTLVDPNDGGMYQTLFAAGIPVIEGNSLTTTDYGPPQAPAKGTAVMYTPGLPGLAGGLASFIGSQGLGFLPSTVYGLYDQGDTASEAALSNQFAASTFLSGVTVKSEQISQPLSTADMESVLASIPKTKDAVLVPILPAAQCVSLAQALKALNMSNIVVTTGACADEQVSDALGKTFPNGWYFGGYGTNDYMYDSKLPTSQQLAVYVGAVDTLAPGIDYTGFAGTSFDNIMTVAKLYNKLGPSATSAQLAKLIQNFTGPQFGISGAMTCGNVDPTVYPAICGGNVGVEQFLNKSWYPVEDGYNNNLINVAAPTPPQSTTVGFTSQVIPANGTSTTTMGVTVLVHGKPLKNAVVTLNRTLFNQQVKEGRCGKMSAFSGKTNSSGVFKVKYTSSTHISFCVITTKYGDPVVTRDFIDQENATLLSEGIHYTISASPRRVVLKAITSDTKKLDLTVKHGSTLIEGDLAAFISEIPSAPGSCGVLKPYEANTGPTFPAGKVVLKYTPSTVKGTCTLRGQESETGARSNLLVIIQGN